MREWSHPVSTLLLIFGLWLFCFFVYLSHIPLNYTYDGMVFASRVEQSNVPLWDIFHPHHLLYIFLGRLIFLWGRAHGATWDGLVTLQFFDLMTGALGVVIAFHLLVRVTQDRLISALSALGLGFSFSYWYFSTSPGVRIFATVTPLLTWYVLTYAPKKGASFGIWIGLAHTLAILGHQTNILLLPAFLGAIGLLEDKSLWQKVQTSLYYLISLSVSVLAVYGFIGRFACYRITYASWVWWVFSYLHVRQWGGHLNPMGLQESGFAMIKAFLHPESILSKPLMPHLTFLTVQTLLTYALWVVLAVLVLRFKTLWKNQKQVLWISFLWFTAFVPFFIWWEPWNIEFWVSSTVPCWILMGVIVSNFSSIFAQPILRLANRVLVISFWGGVVTLLFFYNFTAVVKDMETPIAQLENQPVIHGQEQLLNAIHSKISSKDLLVLDGINTIPFYIDRYDKRSYLSLHAFFKKYQEAAKAQAEALSNGKVSPLATPLPPADPWADLTNIFKNTWEHHHKVWVLAEAVDEKNSWRVKLENLMGMPLGELTNFFNGFELQPIVYHHQVYFYQVLEPENTFSPSASSRDKIRTGDLNP